MEKGSGVRQELTFQLKRACVSLADDLQAGNPLSKSSVTAPG